MCFKSFFWELAENEEFDCIIVVNTGILKDC